MEIKVSIIVPIYNVEKYLVECIYSVISQTFQEMEIILVDDGSTDRSPEIMQEFAVKDIRIRIITQTNRGVSSARNTGLRAAKGEYILFIDSDDAIMPKSVETLYQKAIQTDSDLLIGNALWCDEDGHQTVFFRRTKDLNSQVGISGEECYIKLMEFDTTFPPLVYLFFIKRELIIKNNLFFKAGIIHEDELWCIQAMLNATRVTLSDYNYYHYRKRNGSLMNSNNIEFRINSLFTIAKEIIKLIAKLKKEKKPTELINSLYIKLFSIAHQLDYTRRIPDNKTNAQSFLNRRFFTKKLIEIYPELTYRQQRKCLMNHYYNIF